MHLISRSGVRRYHRSDLRGQHPQPHPPLQCQSVDSRTILDGAGAEKLLGMGGMLFMPVGNCKHIRIQGTFVRDGEISRVLDITASGTVQYDEAMIEAIEARHPGRTEGRRRPR